MIANRLRSPRRLFLAAALVVGSLFVAWAAVRATALQLMARGASNAGALVAGEPEFVLASAMGRFVADQARVRPSLLPAVREAAVRIPLDERPYLLVGSDHLWAGRSAAATATLEAGRRLDAHQRWIHVLLLDRYLRTGKYALAAQEFGVLSRLVDAAQSPIAAALAQMSVAPKTRNAVRLTLREDAALERSVLATLAAGDVPPSTIFAMASPSAFAAASAPGGWGSVLVDRLVRKGSYATARTVWQRVNRLSDRQPSTLLYNAELDNRPEPPPFNWSLASGDIGALDMRGNRLEVTYYGRANGDLAKQLLTLSPGSYRFATAYGGLAGASGASLAWSVICADRPDAVLGRMDLPESGANQRQVAFRFTVPAGCPGQYLRLSGLAGEFPTPVSATIARVQLERLGHP